MDTRTTENGRRRSKRWPSAAAFAAGLLLLAVVLVALSAPLGEEGWLGRWLTAYRHEHVLLGLGSALVVGGLLRFVPGRRLKLLRLFLGTAAVLHWSRRRCSRGATGSVARATALVSTEEGIRHEQDHRRQVAQWCLRG